MPFLLLVIPLIGGLLLYAGTRAATISPGRSLQRKFVALGTLKGQSRQAIIDAVGKPQAISAAGANTLLQWQATGYHIALLFDADGTCLGVRHQYSAR